MAIISNKKLDFWIENNYNVLFIGKHGVGKTHAIIDAFNRNNLKWLYFSASTLDPFVDLIGVPKEVVDENGNRYLDLVRPKALQNDEIEAIFFDEYNRSKPKVRNAVMELIQFKSINGKKFNNLKVVWAAINPDDDDDDVKYDVETLDPAQKDRFHVIIDVPYTVDKNYLKEKYGNSIADGAVEWWNGLTKELKDLCSPRRLDYALDVYTKGGDLYDVLDKSLNVTKLLQQLKSGSYASTLKQLFKNKNDEETIEFFSNINNQDGALKLIQSNKQYISYFMNFYPKETLSKLLDDSKWKPKLLIKELETVIKPVVEEKLKFLYTKTNVMNNYNNAQTIKLFNEFLGEAGKIVTSMDIMLKNELDQLICQNTNRRIAALRNVKTLCQTVNLQNINYTDVMKYIVNFVRKSQSGTIQPLIPTILSILNSVQDAMEDEEALPVMFVDMLRNSNIKQHKIDLFVTRKGFV